MVCGVAFFGFQIILNTVLHQTAATITQLASFYLLSTLIITSNLADNHFITLSSNGIEILSIRDVGRLFLQ